MRAKLGVLTAFGMAILLFVSVAAEADSGRRGDREYRGPDYSYDHQRHRHRDARRHHYRDHGGHHNHHRRHARRHYYGHHRPYYGHYGRPHYRHGYRHHRHGYRHHRRGRRHGHRHGHRRHYEGYRYYQDYGVPPIVFSFPFKISHGSTQEGSVVRDRDIVWNEPRYGDQTDRQGIRWVDDNSEGYCREFQSVSVVAGREQRTYGKACRQPDGSWQIVH